MRQIFINVNSVSYSISNPISTKFLVICHNYKNRTPQTQNKIESWNKNKKIQLEPIILSVII